MTQITEEQQQIDVTARNVAAKLQAFHESLTADERLALDLALQQMDARPEDVAGYQKLNWTPSPIGCALWQERARSAVEVLTLGYVTNFTPDCSQMPPPSQPA